MTFLTGGLNFSGNATFLILLILAKQEGASAGLIGVMFAIASVGALAGALAAPWFQKRFGYAQVIISSVWVSALIIPTYALAPNPIVLGILGAVGFITGPIYNAVQFSYRVSLIPDELQGRVNSAVRMVAFGAIPLGSALAGVLIQAIGAVPAVLCFGAVEIVFAILTTFNRHVRAAKTALPEDMPA
jgi:MFS family permease